MTPHTLETIHSDILVAKAILYSKEGLNEIPYLINQAAYHCAQAIEKSLKAIINNGGKLTNALHNTHNIDALMLKAEVCREGIIREYPLIAENSEVLSQFNALRYCGKGISKNDTIKLYKQARDLYQDLLSEFLKEHPDKKRYFAKSVREYDALEKLRLSKPTVYRD